MEICQFQQGVQQVQEAEEPLPNVEEPKLFGPARSKRSSAGYPPSNSRHWFNDAELANAHAVDDCPEAPDGIEFRYNYPRPSYLVPDVFSESAGKRALTKGDRVVVQQFQSEMHWHSLVLFGPMRRAFLWQPAGPGLALEASQRVAIERAFDAAPKLDGWTLETIDLVLQIDGYHCGPWAHWCRCRAFEFGAQWTGGTGDRGFKEFLLSHDAVQPLGELSGRAYKRAGRSNGELMQALRGKLAVLMRVAHAKGLLPWEHAQHAEFRANRADSACVYIDLDEEDDE